MRLAVRSKCQRSSVNVPVARVIRELTSNHLFDGAVEPCCLSIVFGVGDCRERIAYIQYLVDASEKRCREVSTIFGEFVFGWAVTARRLDYDVLRDLPG